MVGCNVFNSDMLVVDITGEGGDKHCEGRSGGGTERSHAGAGPVRDLSPAELRPGQEVTTVPGVGWSHFTGDPGLGPEGTGHKTNY